MIKTVLFDLDDTIFDFNMSEKIAIIKTFESFGYDVTDEMILKYSQYNISQWKRLELGEISREEVKVNRFKLLLMIWAWIYHLKKQLWFMKKILQKVTTLLKGQKKCLIAFIKIMIYTLFQTGLKSARGKNEYRKHFPLL